MKRKILSLQDLKNMKNKSVTRSLLKKDKPYKGSTIKNITGNIINQILLQNFEMYLSKKFGWVKEKGVTTEVVFNKIMPTRRQFRADYLIEDIIIEINGGQWINGRHNRGGKGYENDLTKINTAQYYGFKVYQFTYEMLKKQTYKTLL
ncbi:MAG: hypothetical protein EOL88_06420 [Bacteroidia bacterium]|nr:hypothetical protein [Bacteroidia bacterium]